MESGNLALKGGEIGGGTYSIIGGGGGGVIIYQLWDIGVPSLKKKFKITLPPLQHPLIKHNRVLVDRNPYSDTVVFIDVFVTLVKLKMIIFTLVYRGH